MNDQNSLSASEVPDLKTLFKQADKLGKRRYHRLTSQDLANYRAFDHWRYKGGDYECGTSEDSRQWVKENSGEFCPVCDRPYANCGGKTIDHKLPRAQYPWLSMDFRNFWVICLECNREKGERHWYEYERYILKTYHDRAPAIRAARPTHLLKF